MMDVYGDISELAQRSRAMIRLGCANCQHKWQTSLHCLLMISNDDTNAKCNYFKEDTKK